MQLGGLGVGRAQKVPVEVVGALSESVQYSTLQLVAWSAPSSLFHYSLSQGTENTLPQWSLSPDTNTPHHSKALLTSCTPQE